MILAPVSMNKDRIDPHVDSVLPSNPHKATPYVAVQLIVRALDQFDGHVLLLLGTGRSCTSLSSSDRNTLELLLSHWAWKHVASQDLCRHENILEQKTQIR